MQNIIIANFSSDSIALIQWAIDTKLKNFCVLSVDTGFSGFDWNKHLSNVFDWLNLNNIEHYHLKAENSFTELVNARKHFPSQQFSWCAGFLKGITLLNKIDELDEDGEATIILPHRKDMSISATLLNEFTDEEEKYDYRQVWRPLLNNSIEQIKELVAKTSFVYSSSRSLECQPCIHFTKNDKNKISVEDIKKTVDLENKNNSYMFNNENFDKYLESDKLKNSNSYDEFSKACSWEYSCGL